MKKHNLIIITFSLIVTLIVSCGLGPATVTPDLNATAESLDATAMALAVQQTVMAQGNSNQTGSTIPQSATNTPEPTMTQTLQPTMTETTAPVVQDLNTLMKEAKILLYEDVTSTGTMGPYVHQAAQALGLKRVTEIGDDIGKFMELASGTTTFDLVIVAAEVHTAFKGELFDSVISQVDRGSAVIIEIWYLDQIFNGRIRPLMDRCGVDFYRNWKRGAGADKNMYVVFWNDPENPIFNVPNKVDGLWAPLFYWSWDAGDLMELPPSSNAIQLASVESPNYTTDHGVLYSCLEGQMILQTFCSHDYPGYDMIDLYENYITNTLKAHFEKGK